MNPDQLDDVDRKVLGDVEKHGWSCISVFPTKEDGTVPFNYTVGLVEHGHPDLIVMGLSNEQLYGILNAAVTQIQDGATFRADSYVDRVLKYYSVGCVEVLDTHHPVYPMSMATRLYGHVQGLQLVWPDRRGRFPWHRDFSTPYKDRQVLLGPWKGSV
jgi:hypothetical protein